MADKAPKERLCLSCDAEVAKMFRELADDMHITMSSCFAVIVQVYKEMLDRRINQ